MAKYIDAATLIAEIERWRDKAKEKYNESTYSMGRCDALAEFRNHIVSLLQDQPEDDLEKEMEEHAMHLPFNDFADDSEVSDAMEWVKAEFLHFYELGLNAKKE